MAVLLWHDQEVTNKQTPRCTVAAQWEEGFNKADEQGANAA